MGGALGLALGLSLSFSLLSLLSLMLRVGLEALTDKSLILRGVLESLPEIIADA